MRHTLLFSLVLGSIACGGESAESDESADPAVVACSDADIGQRTGSPVYEGELSAPEGMVDTGYYGAGAGAETFRIAWAAPSSDRFVFSTLGSSFDTVIELYEGCYDRRIGMNDDGGVDLDSRLAFETEAETTYLLTVLGYSAADFGSFSVNLERE